jgi:succinate dehydrogenase/fumarate reductase flavoprotein subunit
MAGLVAAAQARARKADVILHEKLDRLGGSMRLSSGVIWRHRDLDRFLAECPQGNRALQRLVFEHLDRDLAWLESLGAPVLDRETSNELTTGLRFDPAGLTESLTAAGGEVRLGSPFLEVPDATPAILATGGFPASRELLAEHVTGEADHVLIRAAPGSVGDGLRIGLEAGGTTSAGLEQIYGRNMPAPPARIEPADFVRAGQLYARHATVTNENGERYEARTWSETDVAQWTAQQPRARAWFRVEAGALGARNRYGPIAEQIEIARSLGASVADEGGARVIETVAGVTSTLGGLAIDEDAQVAPGIFAAGGDVGGIATGGYASGLAAALVIGRIAADAALGESRP